MSKKCVKCAVDCNADLTDAVSCVECNDTLHVQCAGLSETRKNTRNRPFRCPKCKDGKDSASVSSVSDSEESSLLKAINSLRADFKKTLADSLLGLETKINDNLNEKFEGIDRRVTAWQESMDLTINGLKADNLALRQDCDALKTHVQGLNQQVAALTEHLQDLQQYTRIDNLEIVGIPLTKNEDIYTVLKAVANTIKMHWRSEDVSVAHRLPARRQRHPNIIIKFTSRTAKNAWFSAAKKLGRITADMLHGGFPNTPVFINEHLAAHSKAVLSHAKQLVKEKHLAYAWVKEGKILVKKTADGRAVRVRSIVDLEAAAQRRAGGGDGGSS